MPRVTRTIVAVNAHPDDEAFLMAGTLARAAAAGDRVVLAVATGGDLGPSRPSLDTGANRAAQRRRELECSAAAIGAARVEWLGYADSGSGTELYPDPPGLTRFVRAPVSEAAARVAHLLREESADLVIGYDASGGYGHRDHVHLHHVTRAAAALTGTRLLEATVPREYITRALRVGTRLYPFPPTFNRAAFETAYLPRASITHHIDVRPHLRLKRAAMRAHVTQTTADAGGDRTLGVFVRIPWPLYGWVFGREWFSDPARIGMHATDIWQESP